MKVSSGKKNRMVLTDQLVHLDKPCDSFSSLENKISLHDWIRCAGSHIYTGRIR